MWSGPRNISTAMMRSWGNRGDTYVVDEPLYAHYLLQTGKDHPVAEQIIASQENDWRDVVRWLTEAEPDGQAVFYQKHMAQHLLPAVGRDWLGQVTNCFLIRHPREVIVSYLRKNGRPSVADVGFEQQLEVFDWVRANVPGETPPVLDARDVLADPERMLRLLCEAVGVAFTDRMLSWPPGLRPSDGVWAPHWYTEVATSTGFRPYTPRNEPVPDELADVYERCLACYERLHAHRLR